MVLPITAVPELGGITIATAIDTRQRAIDIAFFAR